jgi:holdfast attachment protein HfaA
MGFSGTGTAIGNQLNVNTSGSFNTVIVNSTQINNGDQTVNLNFGKQAPPSCSGGTPSCKSGVAYSPAQQTLNGGLDF